MEWGDGGRKALHVPSGSFQVFLECSGEEGEAGGEEELPSSVGSSALTSGGSLAYRTTAPPGPPARSALIAAAS